MSKITVATVKSFIKNNRAALLVNQTSSFDGMVDGVRGCHDGFSAAVETKCSPNHDLGISGVWLVGQSRDYCGAYAKNGIKGFVVDNCCGSFIVGIAA